jgi:hypothetical protein
MVSVTVLKDFFFERISLDVQNEINVFSRILTKFRFLRAYIYLSTVFYFCSCVSATDDGCKTRIQSISLSGLKSHMMCFCCLSYVCEQSHRRNKSTSNMTFH